MLEQLEYIIKNLQMMLMRGCMDDDVVDVDDDVLDFVEDLLH